MSFVTLGLCEPILNALADQGYSTPTPIQEQAIPVVLSGKDLIAAAQTGTGKTASFVLPILQRFNIERTLRGKRIRALILTPTRELAVQVEANITNYSKYLSLSSMAMYGGVDDEPQKQRLLLGIDILVATPGRLLDLAHQRALHFDELEVLVLDEADRMLDMGFIEDINKIIERLPKKRQNLLFSATISNEVRKLAKTAINDPVEIAIAPDIANMPKIDQYLITVDKEKKSALLSHLITNHKWDQALIFIETKHGAAKLVSQLEKRGIAAECLHSGRSQAMREKILADFKSGEVNFLVATGIAARGIDIGELTRVVNYDLPNEADDYIHRIGRTGRAGATGEAVSFVAKDNFRNLCAIESRLGHLIVRKDIDGFVAENVVPISILNYERKYQPEKRKSSPYDNNSDFKGDRKSFKNDKKSSSKGTVKTKPKAKTNIDMKLKPRSKS